MMLHKARIFNYILSFKKLNVRYSALFINGSKATDTFVYITPHIDIERIKNRKDLQNEIARRKSTYDLNKFESLWSFYEEIKQRKLDYDKKRADISRELSQLMKIDPESDAAKKYKIQNDLIKDNLKKLKVPLWSAEENAMVQALAVPNSLHRLTPDDTVVLHTHLTAPSNKKDHLKIGKDLGIINFKKNKNYYLTGDAAIFELGAKFYFSEALKKNGFVQFSNPDFVKSVIIEGCGEDHTDSDKSFILHHTEDRKVNVDSRLHLTGGGSLTSYMAYHAKNVINAKNLPFKYFSMGRQYVPAPSDEDSLFHVSQSSVIQMFGGAKDSNELEQLLQDLTETLKTIYGELGYHFRLSYVPADKLLSWESLRLSVEMYSSSLASYVEVGNVSLSGDYISKRLLFTYTEKKESKFPHIISGTLLNVPKLLACVLEQDEEFSVPTKFRVENWSI